MTIPRLSHFDQFFVFEDGHWRPINPKELVRMYNIMADRYEVILSDIEEIIGGANSGTDASVHTRTPASTEHSTRNKSVG